MFIDYVKILTRVPVLHEQMEAERKERGGGAIIPDAAQTDELDDLVRRAPKVIALLPDVLHRGRSTDDRHAAAIEEMTQRLLAVVGKARPGTLVSFLISCSVKRCADVEGVCFSFYSFSSLSFGS